MLHIKNLFDNWELEKKVYRTILKGVIGIAFVMASFDFFFCSRTLAFIELMFALSSISLLYCAITHKLSYAMSSRLFLFSMAVPIYWNLFNNTSPIESTILFIFLPIIAIVLRPLKEVLIYSVVFGGSFIYITVMGVGLSTFTYMELFKITSMQALISFFVVIYVQTNKDYRKVISTQAKELEKVNKNLETLYKEKQIEASTDHLTGLSNRAALMSQLEYLHARYKRQKEVYSFIMLDIDKFKSVNDTFGHQKGDMVLQHVADITLECIREVDTSARYGGEEFVILLPQTNIVSATKVAERIRVEIEKKIVLEDRHVTASFGVIEIQDNLGVEELIKGADKALYEAKESGRNKVVSV